eukprot:IDg8379t1
MASRRYGRDTRYNNRTAIWKNQRGPNGKNPIPHKASFAKHILCVDSIISDSDDYNEALDILQEFDDDRWHHIETLYSSEAESEEVDTPQETNFVSLTELKSENTTKLISALSDVYFSHSLISNYDSTDSTEHHQILFNERSGKIEFEGICMYHGAQISLAGLLAFKRYCLPSHTRPDLTRSSETFKLGDRIHKILGTTILRMPIDNIGNYLEYETEIVDV